MAPQSCHDLLADTFYFIALLNRKDAAHAAALAYSAGVCLSLVVRQQRGFAVALTGDHHFEQAGFTAPFKDA
ncbi:MAG: hypothetical protein DCC67_20770 [Planctomycetota bacterium]|nr:MAG: hypothetical protein DCC67_20770 [Planctomycetota bacterium]